MFWRALTIATHIVRMNSQTHHGVLWSSQCRHCVGVHGFGWMKFTEIRRFQIWCFFRVNLPGKMESWLQLRWEAMILTTCSDGTGIISWMIKWIFRILEGSNKMQIRHEFLGAWCQHNTWMWALICGGSARLEGHWRWVKHGEAMYYALCTINALQTCKLYTINKLNKETLNYQ